MEMTQEEMKQNILDILDWDTDVSVAVESFARDIKFEMKKSTVEADLKEAKSSAKKLIEKIDEYLESLKPKFNVGDYITKYVEDRKLITKIDELKENKSEAHGLWYDQTLVNVKQDYWYLTRGNEAKHATPEEIAEYESALSFHKHRRDPFEVKDGDLIKIPSGRNQVIAYPEGLSKIDFFSGRYTLLKTAEELEEWLGADNE